MVLTIQVTHVMTVELRFLYFQRERSNLYLYRSVLRVMFFVSKHSGTLHSLTSS
jgi:hypothetical protein